MRSFAAFLFLLLPAIPGLGGDEQYVLSADSKRKKEVLAGKINAAAKEQGL